MKRREEKKSREEKEEEKEVKEKQDDQVVTREVKRIAQTTQVLQLLTLAASISMSREEKEDDQMEDALSFEIIVAYTILVIFITLMAQRFWEAAVRGIERLRHHAFVQPGRHPDGAVEFEFEGTSPRDCPTVLTVEDSGRSNEGEDPSSSTEALRPDQRDQAAAERQEVPAAPPPQAEDQNQAQPEDCRATLAYLTE